MKTIVVDGRFFKKKPDGVSRYSTEICKELVSKYKLIIISNKNIYLPGELRKHKNVIVREYLFFRLVPGTLFILFFVPFFLGLKNYTFVGFGHSIPVIWGKKILVIHDLVAFDYPHTMTKVGRVLNKLSVLVSLIFASNIITVSEFTKSRISEKFPRIKIGKKIYISRNSVNNKLFYKLNNKNECVEFNKLYGNNFILSVCTIEPRKNLLQLVQAYEKLRCENLYSGNLLIVGAKGWNTSPLKDYVNNSDFKNDIIFCGFLTDKKVNILMNCCDLFVNPSLYEGFSIPPLEAYSSGAKVLTSIYSEMPYLNLKDMFLYDPFSDDLSLKIYEALNQHNSNEEINYSWADSADVYAQLISKLERE